MPKKLALLAVLGALLAFAQNQYPFQNPNLAIEERVDSILSLMTLDEKLACLNTNTGVPRLGIPNAGNSEGLHGLVRRAQPNEGGIPTTSFAQVIGMSETWDPALISRVGAAQGYEARYVTQNEKYKRPVLVVWGPNADLARDPRWGRNEESYGEDPFLTGTMGAAFSKGMQGDNPKYWQAASLLKHFLANSNETTRGGSSSDFDERLLREYYSAPFRAGFVEGGARSFMASYNAWNHVPMTVNPILKNIAVKEWGVDGIISSDFTAVSLMVTNHKYFPTQDEAVAAAIKTGISQILDRDPDIPGRVRRGIERGLLTQADVDTALRGKFRTVIRLGLVDPPSMVPYARIGSSREPEPWTTEKHKSLARTVARESIVLLKNAANFLPLDRSSLKSVAVVGPRANEVLMDLYGGTFPYAISVRDGIRNKLGSRITVNYAANNDNGAAVTAAKASEVAIVVIGNHPFCGDAAEMRPVVNPDTSTKPCADPGEGREGRDRTSLALSQEELVKQVFAANPKTVVVLVSNFPYTIDWTEQNVPAIVHVTHGAQEQGTAVADVLFGDYNPAGRLTQTWPKSIDQLPPIEDYNIRHGRTYMYFKGAPLYPFGYGLSYTTFRYSNLRFSAPRIASGGEVVVSVDVKNTGQQSGDEVVQLYIKHMGSKVERATKELKGFARVTLAPNETKTVPIPLRADSLRYWDEPLARWQLEEESVLVMLGGSSADVKISKMIAVIE